MRTAFGVSLFVWLIGTLPGPTAFAGARHFTYVYETTTAASGGFEFENWISWQTHSPNDSRFDQVDFRHEIEFGVTSKLQAGIYLADWFYEQDREHSGFAYSDSALELIYNLSNPVADPLGFSLYEEIKAGDRLLELESKLIAQKDFGPFIFAYNATLEANWEGRSLAQRTGELQQSLGASYEVSPRVSMGLELVHEFVFPDWRNQERTRNFFVGPNVAIRHGRGFATVTALAQATSSADQPDFQLRTIFGYAF